MGVCIIFAVDVEGLNFNYDSGFKIQDISFKIEEKTITALTGNNGSGKTTLLRLLVGLLKPISGNVKIFDNFLSRNKQKLWEIRKSIGFLFQNPDDQLFAPTIEEDVSFGTRNLKIEEEEVKSRVDWALEAVGLLEFKNFSPFNLSWGQRKRAALAGLLAMKPKLLILDEPFANLDFKSIYNHLKILEKLRKDNEITIIFTTHNLFFVEHWAEKMLFLDAGKIIFEGSPTQGLGDVNVKKLLGSYNEILSLIK
ncbi:MAG: ABC transporter ATP-binding protein [Promethearchaeota archaeon]|nr:MAG: ABC transporter ATP-binding protein [Candidatus Lokiarchaeota archaeon]